MAALSLLKALCLLPLLAVHGHAQGLFPLHLPFTTPLFGGAVGGNYGGAGGEGAGGFFSNLPFISGNNGNNNSNNKGAPGVTPAAPAQDSDRNHQVDPDAKLDFQTKFKGAWALVSENSGVSGMHVVLLPNNKLIMYDASAFHISDIKLPMGRCVPFADKRTNQVQQDCWAHGVEFDIKSANIRPLKMEYDPWCSSGGIALDGSLVGTGGWDNGIKTVRYLKTCVGCDFQEYQTALADPRWYSTQITLPDGRFLIVGGRRAFSYEYVPAAGVVNDKTSKHFLPLLAQTTDLDENNLYPFVFLSTDGNLFVFANNRSVLINPKTNAVLRELPALDGGARNYPACGMSALLPVRLDLYQGKTVPAEVMVCGGAKHEAYAKAGSGTFLPALSDCNRIVITDPKPQWKRELMPSRRVMGDMLILPTGDLFIVNGAKSGTAAWFFAENPNLTPVLYRPDAKVGERFTELAGDAIPRMYHSSAALLPDGKILIAGSNTNPGYNYTAKYPTELRVQVFSPPYLDPLLTRRRPVIAGAFGSGVMQQLAYGAKFNVLFNLRGLRLGHRDIKVTMYAPPFTTHGYSMNQRLLVLNKENVAKMARGVHRVTVWAPPSSVFAPPGYYLLFVVHRGVPSEAVWVRIK